VTQSFVGFLCVPQAAAEASVEAPGSESDDPWDNSDDDLDDEDDGEGKENNEGDNSPATVATDDARVVAAAATSMAAAAAMSPIEVARPRGASYTDASIAAVLAGEAPAKVAEEQERAPKVPDIMDLPTLSVVAPDAPISSLFEIGEIFAGVALLLPPARSLHCCIVRCAVRTRRAIYYLAAPRPPHRNTKRCADPS
jgi:hypothetical protein